MIFRTLSDRTTVTQRQHGPSLAARRRCRQTFIFSYILERKGEAGVLALDNAHFAKGSLADDSQQPEVIQVHCLLWSADARARACLAPRGRGRCRSKCSRGHDAGLQHHIHHIHLASELSLRTLVGEDDGLAVALPHGGLL